MSTIISIGELLWDVFPDYKRPGGSPANLAYHLYTLGNLSHLVSRVGNDFEGDELVRLIKRKGLYSEFIQKDMELPTGKVTVSFNDQEPSYTIHEPAAWDSIVPTQSLLKTLATADAFCFASLSQRNKITANTINFCIENVPDECVKVFDLNLRPPYVDQVLIQKSIKLADVIKVNENEFEILSNWFNTDNFGQHIVNLYPNKIVVVTLGANGSAMYNQNGYYKHEAYPVSESGDFVGVGDAFLACFVHLFLKNHSVNSILNNANKYSAFIASQKGSMPTVPLDLIESVEV